MQDLSHSIAKALADNAVATITEETVADVMQVDAVVIGGNFRIYLDADGGEVDMYEVTVRRLS